MGSVPLGLESLGFSGLWGRQDAALAGRIAQQELEAATVAGCPVGDGVAAQVSVVEQGGRRECLA